jgi:hypothetical protein
VSTCSRSSSSSTVSECGRSSNSSTVSVLGVAGVLGVAVVVQ